MKAIKNQNQIQNISRVSSQKMSFDFLREILADLIDYDWYDYKSISDDKEYYYARIRQPRCRNGGCE